MTSTSGSRRVPSYTHHSQHGSIEKQIHHAVARATNYRFVLFSASIFPLLIAEATSSSLRNSIENASVCHPEMYSEMVKASKRVLLSAASFTLIGLKCHVENFYLTHKSGIYDENLATKVRRVSGVSFLALAAFYSYNDFPYFATASTFFGVTFLSKKFEDLTVGRLVQTHLWQKVASCCNRLFD